MSEQIYTMQIGFHSSPQGHAPYVLTLNHFLQHGSKKYDTVERLRHDPLESVPGTNDAGLDVVMYDIATKGFKDLQVSPSKEIAAHFGLR
jgi:hypothetical protein